MPTPTSSGAYTKNVTLDVSPHQAFEACTSEDALRLWFADHVEIDPTEGGTFSFWGPTVPYQVAQPNVPSTIIAFVPERQFAFTWNFQGVTGTVDISFDADGDGTALAATHTWDADEAAHEHEYNIHDLWSMWEANLVSFVETGARIVGPDFTDPFSPVILQVEIDAPRDAVWRALTDPAQMNRWMATAASVELDDGTIKPGARYSYGWTQDVDGEAVEAGPTTVIRVDEGRILEHGWVYPSDGATPSSGESRVTWILTDIPSGTLVELRHTAFNPQYDANGYRLGWSAFLADLHRLLSMSRGKSEDVRNAPRSPA